MVNNVAILVNSCDKYSSVWDPFFKLFKKQWQNCDYKIYLNVEEKEYNCDFLNVTTLHTAKNKQWTERIADALKQIKEDYIIFLLEDFFILDEVKVDKLENILLEMMSKKKIGYVALQPLSVNNNKLNRQKKSITKSICLRKHYVYCCNAVASIWRKDFFLQMLYTPTNPWKFEVRAAVLSMMSSYKVCVVKPEENPFSYEINPSSGYGITLGKWLKNNKLLFKKYDIDVDFEELGCHEKDITYKEINEVNHRLMGVSSLRKYLIKNISLKRYIKYYVKFKKFCKTIDRSKKS